MGMTKQEIHDYFKDINAMYNNPNMLDSLSNMIDELLKAKDINVTTKWVSVKDSAPTIQDGQHGIIVCDANKNVHLIRGLIRMNADDGVILYFDDSHSDCYWTIVSGKQPKYNTLIKGNEITHWMPLPDPPKEEDV